MQNVLNQVGRYAGYLGILVCIAAVAGRFYGEPKFLGHAALSWIVLGIAFLVLGCWAKLEAK
jgi:hypothetical protein